MRKPRRPKYRKHSSGTFGLVEWRGKRHRLPGKFNSEESLTAYQEFIDLHVEPVLREFTRRQVEPVQLSSRPTVAEICLAFLDHARTYYPGTDSRGEYRNCRAALQHVLKGYAALAAEDFGPKNLKSIREEMIRDGASRSYVNATANRIKRCWKWAASEELLDVLAYQRLSTVEGLRAGRTDARETPKRQPVTWADVQPILKHLTPQVATMVELQWLTGCRSQSICLAQAEQFRRDESPWRWHPRHKTEHLDKRVVLPIGPRGRELLLPYLDREGYLFSPTRCGRRNLRYRSHYDTISYRQAVVRAQQAAKVRHWTPHQLRHGRGTEVRDRFGVEAAQAILGHESLDSTELYAARRVNLAAQVAQEIG